MQSSIRRRCADTGSAVTRAHGWRGRPGAGLRLLEALEARALLTGTGASPFDAPVFTSLPATPQIAVAAFDFVDGQNQPPPIDLDGNGKADLIVRYDTGTDPKTPFLSALLGQANGSMIERSIVNYPAGDEVVMVIPADLNNDHRLDLVVQWKHPGAGPQFIDTDNDGFPDTLVSGDQNHLDIFVGNADGTFTKPTPTLNIGDYAQVDVFKMNADANADIVISLASTKLDILLGNGNGTFQAPVRSDFGSKMIAEFHTDLNGDNITDVILNYGDFASPKSLEVFPGLAGGSYQPTPSFSDTLSNYTLLGLHKFSGDARPDMLLSIAAPSDVFHPFPPATNVAVLLNNGSASFTETFNKTLTNGLRGVSAFGVAVGDLNGDGVEDMVIFDGSPTATLSPVIVRVEINNGSATFAEPQSFSVDRFVSAYLLDIDNDSRPELIVNRHDADTTPAGSSVFFNGGTGTFITTDVFVTATSQILVSAYGAFQDAGNDHRAEAIFFQGAGGYTAPVTENKFFGFKQNANRTFGVEKLTNFGANTVTDLVVLDYTADHNADALVYQNFVAGNDSNFYGTADSLKVYRGVGDGSLTAPAGVLSFGGSVVPMSYPVDYENDTDFDLFVMGASPAGIYFVKNSGTSNGGNGPTDNAGNSTAAARDIGTVSALQSFPDFVGAADTQDFYRFALSPASQVHIALSTLTSNADIQLLDSNGAVITSSAQSGTADESITRNLTAGTYFIRVLQNSGDTNYSLAVSSAPLVALMGVQLGNTFIASGQTSVDFGTISLGGEESTLTFTVQNNGNDTLTLQTPTLPAGYSAGSDALALTLAPEAIDTFTVRLDAAVVGTKPGNISIGNNSSTNPFLIPVTGSVVSTPLPHIAATGNAVAIADGDPFSDTVDGTDFGSVVVGTTPLVRVFTVTNSGTADLTLGVPTIPAHFTLVDPLVGSLAPGFSDTFSIRLNTDVIGTFAGDVSIVTNDAGRNPFNFAVTGNVTLAPQAIIAVFLGVIPVTSGQPIGINFGDVSQGTPPPTRTFTVRNDGTAPLTLQAPTLPQGFVSGVDTLVTTLLPGAFDTFTVALDTSVVGAAAGDIVITNNDPALGSFHIPILGAVNAVPNEFDALTPTHKQFAFKDSNGSDITVTLAAKTGSATVTRTALTGVNGDIASIHIIGTDAKATLTITGKGSDGGVTTVGAITGNGPLASLTGKTVDLTGVGINLTDAAVIGAITLRDLLNGADINVNGGSLTKGVKVTLGSVGDNSDLLFGSPISVLALTRFGAGGTINTPWIGAITTKADAKRTALNTNFGASLHLAGTGAPKGVALGKFTGPGAVDAGTWTIVSGGIGSITAGSFGQAWQVFAPQSTIASITTTSTTLSGTILAKSVGKVQVKTDLANAHWTLSQAVDAKAAAIGTLTVSGKISSSEIRTVGNIGSVTTGAIADSLIFAGVAEGVTGLPTAFPSTSATIGSFTVKGQTSAASFARSLVAGGILAKVSLKIVDPSNTSQAFGFVADKVKAYSRSGLKPPLKNLDTANGNNDPALGGDFVLRTV